MSRRRDQEERSQLAAISQGTSPDINGYNLKDAKNSSGSVVAATISSHVSRVGRYMAPGLLASPETHAASDMG